MSDEYLGFHNVFSLYPESDLIWALSSGVRQNRSSSTAADSPTSFAIFIRNDGVLLAIELRSFQRER